jgi:hypothetical protein
VYEEGKGKVGYGEPMESMGGKSPEQGLRECKVGYSVRQQEV